MDVRSDIATAVRRIQDGMAASELEGPELEFKDGRGSLKDVGRDLAEACACFANATGGVIVVGIDDKGRGSTALVGCGLNSSELQREIYERTRPALMVEATTNVVAGARLIILTVPQTFEIHSDSRGRATRRVGKSCLTLSPTDQSLLREERRGIDWSAAPATATAANVQPSALATARIALKRVGDDRRPLGRLPDPELLRALGVINSAGRLLRAGELLFCDQAADASPHFIYQYRATPGGEALLVERLDGPLVLAFERLMELTWARRNVTSLTLRSGQQIELADFPDVAIREALANAVLHREHRVSGSVHVEHSPDAFIVTSPGPLVGGVTPQNILTHPSKPRNPRLFNAARLLRLAEETGRGVDRIYRAMIGSGRDLPVIEDRADSVRVVLQGGAPRTQVARFVAQLPEAEREDTDTLLVLFTLCTSRTIGASDLAPIIQKSPAEAEAVLERLSHDAPGLLEPTRETHRLKRSEYRLRAETLRALGGAVRYHRRTLDETDRKVIAHVREYDRVTNRTLQNMFDIDVFRARDLLADLVRREILVRTSTHARGRGVEYGPGKKFPIPSRKGVASRRRVKRAGEPPPPRRTKRRRTPFLRCARSGRRERGSYPAPK